jgi:hypothetical protein
MTGPRSTSISTQSVSTQRVTILSVDPVAGTALAQTRYLSSLTISLDYHVGAVHVIPAVNEQWFVSRYGSHWMLDRKVPFRSEVLSTVAADPTSGTYQLGSSGPDVGPTNLLGSQVNVMAPLGVLAVTTTNRPSAVTVGAGGHIFDKTLGKPIWSNGTAWVDASGATV